MLSVLLVVKNEEKQLAKCLRTIMFADEVVVILDKSSDNSEKIAKKFTDRIYSGSWDIEGDRRNFGLGKCKGKWIFEIDADERVSNNLQSEIIDVVKTSRFDWHPINVNNYLGDDVVKFGWGAYFGKSSYAGLFKKGIKIWGRQRVHPKITLTGRRGESLKNKLDHYYCKNISDLFKKLDSYSSAKALDMRENKIKETMFRNVRRIFSRFWKCYFLRKGYKEKKIGLIIAIVASLISYLKYKIDFYD
jgi:glycosyltransferase involved in cell wall biosynthesis